MYEIHARVGVNSSNNAKSLTDGDCIKTTATGDVPHALQPLKIHMKGIKRKQTDKTIAYSCNQGFLDTKHQWRETLHATQSTHTHTNGCIWAIHGITYTKWC